MKVEYIPRLDDIFRLRQAVQRRQQHGPLAFVLIGGPLVVAAGAGTMAVTGSPLWWGTAALAVALAMLTLAALRKLSVTRGQVEKEFAASQWMREPFRLEADDAGLTYEHGPYRTRAVWSAFARIVETSDHLVLEERRAPAALMYGLPKQELDRAGGTAAWRAFLSKRLR